MRILDRSSAFKRDYKKLARSPRHRKDLETLLPKILSKLLQDEPLNESQRDHQLTGNWVGYRECHIKPDLLLIYKIVDTDQLQLARIGSHSNLFKK